MSDLFSKVTASGLSAGVFLLWWPAHVASQDSEALLARGVLWALAFEILLLAFRPLERAVARAVRTRETDVIAPRRIAPLLALAAVAAVVPVTMLCGERAPLAAPAKAAAPKVIVKREIVRREVVVRRVNKVVRVPVPAATTAAPPATVVRTAPAKSATPKKTTATPKPASTSTSADSKADLSASTVTTTTPAATPTTPTTQPTTTAAPAATTAAQAAATTTSAAG